MKHQLDFEKPILELQRKLDELRKHPEKHSMEISFDEEIAQIERKIADGSYPAGDRLPGEVEIAQAHRVNRHTVRQAIQQLQAKGLVRIERGRGTFVQEELIAYRLGKSSRFSHSLSEQHLVSDVDIQSCHFEPASEAVARLLGVAEGAPLLRVEALDLADEAFARLDGLRLRRLHGDCHPGNILWTPDGPHFVDLDDACMGPAVQDLWMLLSGERAERTRQLDALLDGYESVCEFDWRELKLIEPLRTLRLIHHSAWIARRWHDPAFPAAFPWFDSGVYWQQQADALRQQIELMSQSDDTPAWLID